MRPLVYSFSCALVLMALAAACGDDDPAAPSSTDGGREAASAAEGGTSDADHEDHEPGDVDAGPPPIRCTDEELAANDKTDGGALEITFLKGANPRQYDNNCATVKVGASVTFSGGFVQHPLEPAGGDSPNPIPYTNEDQPDDKLVITMTSAGTFGYQCEFHRANMFGAIRVVP